jgi:DNA invertase Pin-like site-specific DNA recombinase
MTARKLCDRKEPTLQITTTPRHAALYARVSTRNGQTPDNQIRALCEVASRKGWEIVDQYVDNGVSGAKGREERPEFDRLLKDATRRKFDVLMAWSVDRLGRSLQDLVSFLGEIQANRIDLYLHVQGLDTTTPAGRALFQMLGVFAEFERSIIQERIHAGLARARTKGVRLGRPPAVERLAERQIIAARAAAPQKFTRHRPRAGCLRTPRPPCSCAGTRASNGLIGIEARSARLDGVTSRLLKVPDLTPDHGRLADHHASWH